MIEIEPKSPAMHDTENTKIQKQPANKCEKLDCLCNNFWFKLSSLSITRYKTVDKGFTQLHVADWNKDNCSIPELYVAEGQSVLRCNIVTSSHV